MNSASLPFRAVAAGLMTLAVSGLRSLAQEGPLRTAAAVQQLSAEGARQSREVRLRGVVTFTWHTGTTEFTVEDDTGAIWCPAVALPFDCRVGTEVEIEGRCAGAGETRALRSGGTALFLESPPPKQVLVPTGRNRVVTSRESGSVPR